MNHLKRIIIAAAFVCYSFTTVAQKVDYSVVSVPEEVGLELKMIKNDNIR